MAKHPDLVLRQLDKLDSEDSLIDFIKLCWHVLEPGREFSYNWHIEAVCEHLEAVTRGEITRLLINVPPGSMKSLTTNVFWPAWEWGPRGGASNRYVNASYSQDLATRDNRKCRLLIGSPFYQSLWGDKFQIDPDQDSKIKYENNKTGFKFATSVGGIGTGERGDRFIVDDPHNAKDTESDLKREAACTWFTESVTTRVNSPEKSAIIVIMQRLHERDVSGVIFEKDMGYDHLCIPMEFEPERRCYSLIKPKYMETKPEEVFYHFREKAWRDHPDDDAVKQRIQTRYNIDPRKEDGDLMWPHHMTAGALKRDKNAMGEYATAGQFQQRPAPRGGGIIDAGKLQIVDIPPKEGIRVRAWDLATSVRKNSPYTVGARLCIDTMGRIYIEDIVRQRVGPDELENLIKTTAQRDGKLLPIDLPQDPGQGGKFQISYLGRQLQGYVFRSSLESGSKEQRAMPFASQVSIGNVFMLRGVWNRDFIGEAAVFPAGQFKDQIDAVSRAYSSLLTYSGVEQIGAAPEEIGKRGR